MDTPPRDEAQEALLRDIIAQGSDAVCLLMFLNDNDGLEGEGEEAAGYLHGSDDPMPVQEGEGEEVDREDGSGDPMPVQEGDRDAGSGDRTESGQEVYMLVKHVLTS